MTRLDRHCADVHEQKAAGAVSVFGLTGLEARLADERGLLIAQDCGDDHVCTLSSRAVAYCSLLEQMRGSICSGMPNVSSIFLSQASVWRLISCVRLAFVTSVT